MKKKLSNYSVFSIAFGGIIGWGAFILPGSFFLQKANFYEIFFAFALSTFSILIVAASYCLNLKSCEGVGGEVSSSHSAFGMKHGFFCGWMIVLVYVSIVALNINSLPIIIRQISPTILESEFLYLIKESEVYASDLVICFLAVIFFAIINTRDVKKVAALQNIVSSTILISVLSLTLGVLWNINNTSVFTSDLLTLKDFDASRIFPIFAIAPWAYIGFNIIPQVRNDINLTFKKAYQLMCISVICGTLVYLLMTLITVFGTSGMAHGTEEAWVTGFAVENILGRFGLYLVFIAIIVAVLAGINAFLYGGARLLSVMGELHYLPLWFARKINSIPVNAILFISIIVSIAPLFGRTVLLWIVDMSSVGAAIGFLYTGLSGISRYKNQAKIASFIHVLTCIISISFLLFLLVPSMPSSLGKESYIFLLSWMLLGFIFYFSQRKVSVSVQVKV